MKISKPKEFVARMKARESRIRIARISMMIFTPTLCVFALFIVALIFGMIASWSMPWTWLWASEPGLNGWGDIYRGIGLIVWLILFALSYRTYRDWLPPLQE